jgi:hypothetical protein
LGESISNQTASLYFRLSAPSEQSAVKCDCIFTAKGFAFFQDILPGEGQIRRNDQFPMTKQNTIGSIHPYAWLAALALLTTIGGPVASGASAAQDEKLRALDGTWLFVEDRSKGVTVENGQAPMSARFSLRVEKDAVIYPRSRGDERITLDNSVIEKKEDDGTVVTYRGKWTKKDGWLEYWFERVEPTDKLVIKRVFRITDDGLLVYVFSNKFRKRVALYRHPEDIALTEPAKATIADLEWLAGAWVGTRRTSSIEERWSPPKGGAMLGVSRTVREEKMRAFENLRIVERDGGLVYVAQPGGRKATEFVLTKLENQRAEFVNPRHDYPQRIVYELSKDGALTASVGFAKGALVSSVFKREGK